MTGKKRGTTKKPGVGAAGVPPPPPGMGQGRRKGVLYLSSREAIEKAASKLMNEFLETKRQKVTVTSPDGKTVEKVGVLLDGTDLNALNGCMRTILDSKKFTEQVALKLRDDTLKRELDETVAELEEIKELLVKRGILSKGGDPIH